MPRAAQSNTPLAGLTLAELAQAKGLPLEFLRDDLGLYDARYERRPAVAIPYRDATGHEVALRYRIALEGQRFRWRRGDHPILYGLGRLAETNSPASLFLVEGESDAWTLWHYRLPAVGIPGAANWSEDWASDLGASSTLYVVDERDQGARTLLGALARSSIRDRVQVIHFEGVKDPSELHLADADRFAERLDAACAAAVSLEERAAELSLPYGEATGEHEPSSGRRQAAESNRVLKLAADGELFHTPAGEPFADVWVDGHRETWLIGSHGFADWLGYCYWILHQGAPREAAVKDALRSLIARARHGGPERDVFLRVGEADGAVYLDLADAQWQAVEITADGWCVVAEPAVRFRRGNSSLALPVPIVSASIDELRPFLNVADEAQWRLLVAWAVFAALPWGPYPPLILGGQQDSGKSTTARVLRALLDPDEAPLTTAPRDDEDLIVTACSVWCPVYDNLSSLDARLSDTLCRLAEGAGLQRRARYTDSEVVTIRARRPVIITGIGDLATRGDLLDRALTLTLPSLADTERKSEVEFWRAFEAARPHILGALCDLIVGVLRELPRVVLPVQPRMADFARVGVALERVCDLPAGSFLDAYEGNRAAGHEITLDAYPIVEPLEDLVEEHPFDGLATELLKALDDRMDEATRRMRSWPKSPNTLSNQLSRLAPSLGHRGLVVESREVRGRKTWRITKNEVSADGSAPSAPGAAWTEPSFTDGTIEWPAQGADGGADPLSGADPKWADDRFAGREGADGADGVPIHDRHPGHARDGEQPAPGQSVGADGADPSSLNPEEEREERESRAPEVADQPASAPIRCDDYLHHQSSHRRVDGRWICDACEVTA